MVFFYRKIGFLCKTAVFRAEEGVHCAKRKEIAHKLFALNNPA
jgi:hypothetical protein